MAKISIDLNTGKLQKEQSVIGIDLGTTNSLIASIDGSQNPYCIVAGESTKIPSVIHINEGETLVGAKALNNIITQPQNTLYSIKRLMGKTYTDVQDQLGYFNYQLVNEEDKLVKVVVNGKKYTPIELSSYLLKELKTVAEQALNKEVQKVVITVPAYFNDTQRQATRDAGKLAGLDVLRIINEPTAASLAYGIGSKNPEEQKVAVYDFGGGTFDISILRIHNGIYEVVSTNGNTFLGGDDLDHVIVNHWLQQGLEISTESDKQALRISAEKAKIHLSANSNFEETIQLNGSTASLNLSLKQLNELIKPLIDKTLACCNDAIEDASFTVEEIDEVILVGGSTRNPLVKEMVGELFSNSKINDSLNPDEIVALGAALEADILAGNRTDMLLLDVTPLSLGIETLGGLMDVVIPRNNKLPTHVKKEYSTSVDGQINLQINVFQGEREMVADNRALGAFILKGIPAMPAGFPKIEVSFMLNADGILKVKAKELRSGVSQEVELQPKYGVSDEEIKEMLKLSIDNAQEDFEKRSLAEAISEANQIIYATEKMLKQYPDLLTEDENKSIQHHISNLNQAIHANNQQDIVTKTELLNNTSKPFAERLMDISVSKALKGKSIT